MKTILIILVLSFLTSCDCECVDGHYETRVEYDAALKITIPKTVFVCDEYVCDSLDQK